VTGGEGHWGRTNCKVVEWDMECHLAHDVARHQHLWRQIETVEKGCGGERRLGRKRL